MKNLKVVLICFFIGIVNVHSREHLDISGTWQFRLDPENKGELSEWFLNTFSDRIQLPGTTAEGGYGNPPNNDFLKRVIKDLDPQYGGPVPKFQYEGCAWYQRTIFLPNSWASKRIFLFMERARWKSDVWVNGIHVGGDNSLSTPHVIDLSQAIKQGNNQLVIKMDNSQMFDLGRICSANSYHTQGMWNGIIGRIELIQTDPIYIYDLQAYPDVDNKRTLIKVVVNNTQNEHKKARILLSATSPNGKKVNEVVKELSISKGKTEVELSLPLGDDLMLWDEFTPVRYKIEAKLIGNTFFDEIAINSGMRKLEQDGTHILINGEKVFLRGTLECANFPLTAYSSMNEGDWLKIMGIIKANGLNHVRFHSWTPPEAAFEAADRLGIYLLTEAPRANSGYMEKREVWIKNEMLRIQKSYANHPSFTLFSSGNELQGSLYQTGVALLTQTQKDKRHLHTFCSGGKGMSMEEGNVGTEDFLVYGVRGNAISKGRLSRATANKYYDNILTPTTDYDLDPYLEMDVPVISHEIGQWCVFPSMDEIKKYTGVMQPENLKLIRENLLSKGLLEQATDFNRVTAKAAAVLYKEDIETVLRSKKSGGFQLLQLNDYPGQGTAHCGLYDGFWDSKEAIQPEEFRHFAGAIVPLLRLPKFIWENNEVFSAKAELRHNGPKDLTNVVPYWRIINAEGEELIQGNWEKQLIPQGEVSSLGKIEFDLKQIKHAQKLTVQVGVKGIECFNHWDVWVYPNSHNFSTEKNIVVSKKLEQQVLNALLDGERVLLMPKYEDLDTAIQGRFLAPFWSPVHWWTRPGRGNVSMSILCDPKHPALENFPTEEYTNWQWCELLDRSFSFILDDFSNTLQPIVQVVDNFSRNHKLGNIIEVKVGKGKLLLCGFDLESELDNRPESRQLKWSLLKYMNSNNFNPKEEFTIEELKSIFKKP